MTWPGLVNSVYWWLFGWMEPEQIQTLRRILWIGENLVAAVLRPVCCGWPPVRWSLRDVDGRFFTCFKATATAPRPKGPIAGFNCFNPEILPLRFRHLSPPFSLLAASSRRPPLVHSGSNQQFERHGNVKDVTSDFNGLSMTF